MLPFLATTAVCGAAIAGEAPNPGLYTGRDTLSIRPDELPRAQARLEAVAWTPQAFEVRCTAADGGGHDAVVQFPSPRPSGDAWQDRVPMWWYAVRGPDDAAIEAPAVLLVHSLLPGMHITRALARGFAARGLHGFVVHMPGYGLRSDGHARGAGVTSLLHGRQAVADVRRARDAIAALPKVKPGPIAIVGTSLGAFVASVAASVDSAFDPVLLLLGGGDSYGVLQTGRWDAAALRQSMERAGFRGPKLRQLVDQVEPLHLAHRLDPARTWLFSARADQVVRQRNSDALAQAVGLDDGHRIWLAGNHYTSVLALPAVLQTMAQTIQAAPNTP